MLAVWSTHLTARRVLARLSGGSGASRDGLDAGGEGRAVLRARLAARLMLLGGGRGGDWVLSAARGAGGLMGDSVSQQILCSAVGIQVHRNMTRSCLCNICVLGYYELLYHYFVLHSFKCFGL